MTGEIDLSFEAFLTGDLEEEVDLEGEGDLEVEVVALVVGAGESCASFSFFFSFATPFLKEALRDCCFIVALGADPSERLKNLLRVRGNARVGRRGERASQLVSNVV